MKSKTSFRGRKAFVFIGAIVLTSFFATIFDFSTETSVAKEEPTIVGVTSTSGYITEANLNDVVLTDFNPEFRLVNYERVYSFPLAYSVNMINGIVDEARFALSWGPSGVMLDTFLLKNGTFLVFNTTFNNPYAPNGRDGANYTFWFKQNMAVTGCSIEQFIGFGQAIFIVYKNLTTMTDLIIVRYDLSFTLPVFVQAGNTTVHEYSGLSSVDVIVKDVEVDSFVIAICGYYDNLTNNVPFFYTVDWIFSTTIDVLEGNTSASYLSNFDDAILRILDRPFYRGIAWLMTNEKIVQITYTPFSPAFMHAIPLQEPIDYENIVVDITKMSYYLLNTLGIPSEYDRLTVAYVEYNLFATSFKGHSLCAIYNHTSATFLDPVYKERDLVSMEIAMLGLDNVMTTFSDLGRGLIFTESDANLNDRQRESLTTTQPMSAFDFFIPFDIDEVQLPGITGTVVRVAFGSGRSIWIAQFSCASKEMFDIGNSKIQYALCERAYITHDSGTKYFRYKMSGKIERNEASATDIVEMGLAPLYIGPVQTVQLSGATAAPFFTSDGQVVTVMNLDQNPFLSGFRVIQVQNFVGFGKRFVDFTVEFDSEFLANVSTFGSYSLVDLQLNMVVYEKYANGTYTQKFLNTNDGSMRFFVATWDYDLQTTIVLEDSHTLDELHVFIGGQEFDPYNVVFDLPYMSVIVTDKYTLETLYNSSSVLFADPVILNIPSKYEFYISYFSTLDKFGFSYDLVSTFVNKTEVTSEFIRVLSPNAEIVVKDFAGSVLKNVTINRYTNGTYIKIGLDIAQVIISNQYTNTTIDFYLTKDGTTIYYQLPSSTSFILRLALGEYHYKIKDANTGEVLFDDNVTIEAAITLSFGFYDVVIPGVPPTGYTFLDTIISAAIFAGVVFIVMLGYNMGYFKKIQESFVTVKKRP